MWDVVVPTPPPITNRRLTAESDRLCCQRVRGDGPSIMRGSIEGSTALWERDRVAMAAAVEHHFALLDAAIAAHGGVHFTFKRVGDGVQAAFPMAPQVVAAAVAGSLRSLLRIEERWADYECAWRCTPAKLS